MGIDVADFFGFMPINGTFFQPIDGVHFMLDIHEVFKMSLSENDGKQELKNIIKNEDNNLYERTKLFLMVNGIFFAAVGVNKLAYFKIILGIVGVMVGLLWFLCTCQSQRVIKALHKEFKENYPHPSDDKYYWVIENALLKYQWFRPAELLGKILPPIFILAWFFVIFIV